MPYRTRCLPSHKQKLTDTFRQRWISRKLQEQGQSPGFAPDVPWEIMSYGDFNKNPCGEGDLASQLPWLQPFGLFSLWRLWIKGQSKAWQQNQEPDPEDQGVMVSLARNIVVKTCKRFRSQIEAVVTAVAVLLTKLIRSTFLCQPVFTSMKSDGFQLCCVILKKQD